LWSFADSSTLLYSVEYFFNVNAGQRYHVVGKNSKSYFKNQVCMHEREFYRSMIRITMIRLACCPPGGLFIDSHTHTHIYIHKHIYIYMCVCVCVCAYRVTISSVYRCHHRPCHVTSGGIFSGWSPLIGDDEIRSLSDRHLMLSFNYGRHIALYAIPVWPRNTKLMSYWLSTRARDAETRSAADVTWRCRHRTE